ncbi:MAG: hypothetical protein ACXVAY_17755 [Mucilaginibacter sp.]
MTFEEFFKKKRIDLDALKVGEPGLFAEFKTHYEQMGEKSFDHTKKYWFNKTRRQFPLAVEVKTERVKIENPLAEQTVTQALTEAPAVVEENKPKLGFVPKFKAAGIPKAVSEEIPDAEAPVNDASAEPTTPKLGFKPKFKAANIPKPASEQTPEAELPVDDTPVESSTPKLGFKPKFKAANMPGPAAEDVQKAETPTADTPAEPTAPKLGFKPKFKAANMPKPAAENQIEPVTPPAEPAVEAATPKLGFKPKFKPAQTAKPLTEDTSAIKESIKEGDTTAGPTETKPQPYKPRFNMKNIPPKATED